MDFEALPGAVRRAVDLTRSSSRCCRRSSRRARLLSREQLIERVWGAGVSITDRVVDNHVLNLRRKLEVTPAEPRYLLSVRGLGYRFESPAESLTER